MAMVNPGVSFNETLLTSAANNDVVTTPLFIGYSTMAAGTVAMQLHCVTSLTQAISLFGDSDMLAYGLRHFFDNGGLCCYVLSLGPPTAGDGFSRLQSLIQTLKSAALQTAVAAERSVGLLLVPEMSALNDISSVPNPEVTELWYQGWKALLSLCEPGQQRFALLELPEVPDEAMMLTQRAFPAENCQNAAAWWPRLKTSYRMEKPNVDTRDSENVTSSYVVLSPLPAVAAAIQNCATENGVWKAPANIALKNTLQPVRNILLYPAVLNSNGVYSNLIRSFRAKGVRLWGCRTLLNDDSSPWRYIQTRLLANSVEFQLRKLARHYLFEPNNEQTWMKLRGQIWTWLRQQWLAGAFYGTTEEEAFSLSIGLNDTMSPEDIDAGKMIMHIQLALLAPAEFIDIQLTLDARLNTTTVASGGE